LITENKNLKLKLEELEIMHEKKQNWLKNNIKSAFGCPKNSFWVGKFSLTIFINFL